MLHQDRDSRRRSRHAVALVLIVGAFVAVGGVWALLPSQAQQASLQNQAVNDRKHEAALAKLVADLKIPAEVLHHDHNFMRAICDLRQRSFQYRHVEKVVSAAALYRSDRPATEIIDAHGLPKRGRSTDDWPNVFSTSYEVFWLNHTMHALQGLAFDLRTNQRLGAYLNQHPQVYRQQVEPLLMRLSRATNPMVREVAIQAMLAAGPMTPELEARLDTLVHDPRLSNSDWQNLMDAVKASGRTSAIKHIQEMRARYVKQRTAARQAIRHDHVFADAAQRTDVYGDPLPPGAVARLGTSRLRYPARLLHLHFADKGRAIEAFYRDGTLVRFDAPTGRRLDDQQLVKNVGWSTEQTEFNADWSRLLALQNGNLRVVERDTGRNLFEQLGDNPLQKPYENAALSPDGRTVAASQWSRSGAFYFVWDVDSGRLLYKRQVERTPSERLGGDRLVISPDGRFLLADANDTPFSAWELRSGKAVPRLACLEGHLGRHLQIGADGHYAVAPTGDAEFVVVDLEQGAELGRVTGKYPRFTPKGDAVVAFMREQSAFNTHRDVGPVLYHLPSLKREPLALADQKYTYDRHAAFSPHGDRLATGLHGDSVLIQSIDGDGVPVTIHSAPDVERRLFSPDGRWLLDVGGDGVENVLRLWNTRTGERVHDFIGHRGWVRQVAVARDAPVVATRTRYGIRLWNSQSGRFIRYLPMEYVDTLALSPDGTRLATSDGSTVHLRNAENGQITQTLTGHQGKINAIHFIGDGEQLLTASEDRTIRLWDIDSGTLLHGFYGHSQPVQRLSYTPKFHDRLVSLGSDGDLRFWHREGEHDWDMWQLKLYDEALDVAIHPRPLDSEFVVCFDDRLEFYAKKEDTPYRIIYAPQLQRVAISPGGTFVATAGRDGVARVWHYDTGKPVFTTDAHDGRLTDLAFTSDGKLITASSDMTVLVWDLTPVRKRLR